MLIKEYLRENYHDEIRDILKADEVLLPDRIIDAELNIGAANLILEGMLESCVQINTVKRKAQVSRAAKLFLCGVLCLALNSRTKVEPFLKYRKDWEYHRRKNMDKANKIMLKLFR